MYLFVVDTTKIQPYIFGSNRLRENVGASHLVAQATSAWALQKVPKPNNVRNAETGELDEGQQIEQGKLAAEVLYAGGGNVVVLCRDQTGAQAFIRQLSRQVLEDAPNLQLVIAQRKFDWNHEVLSRAVDSLFNEELASQKRSRTLSAPLLGLGVTVTCRSTGLPAVDVTPSISGEPGYPASQEILAKIAVTIKRGTQPSAADERLRRILPPPSGCDYPSDFEDLGGSRGEQNYLAVVHADGNGMGQRIMDVGSTYLTVNDNRPYITALRRFSVALQEAAQVALKETLGQVASRIDESGRIIHKNKAGKELVRIELKPEDSQWLLPFRPIVFGGDDVTFVCDGRLGLSLAVQYLRQFEIHTANLPDGEGKATACAGIAIVKTHYPFARAYTLADELCKSAKDYRRKQDWEGSCLDWHFALGGLAGDVKEIRKREYTVPAEGSLALRPVTLDDNTGERHRSWVVVRKGVDEFQGKDWAGRRNKVKALRDALREGSGAVQRFLAKFNEGKPLPEVEPLMTNWPATGWQDYYCGYFDAVELADWFIPLEGGQAP